MSDINIPPVFSHVSGSEVFEQLQQTEQAEQTEQIKRTPGEYAKMVFFYGKDPGIPPTKEEVASFFAQQPGTIDQDCKIF